MALTHISDHQARALARLVEQYRGSATMRGLVSLSTAEHQVLEDALWADYVETIESAEGAQLDVLGKIVDQPREGRDDATYRLWIRARVRLNRSGGTPEDIIAVFAAITQGATRIIIEEQFPAAFILRLDSNSAIDPVQASALLQLAKPAGVRAILENSLSDDPTAFAFDPNGGGFGDVNNAATGGTLATAF